jgi:hypothetical protein
LLLLLATTASIAAAQAAPLTRQAAPGRGELLYSTHCIACHTTQMHWREKRVARDWPTLIVLVDRWQRNERLNWEPQDVVDVARHLNARYYRYPAGG